MTKEDDFMEEALLKVFAVGFIVVILLLFEAGYREGEQRYEEGACDQLEDIQENPEEYGMIYKDDVIDYIKDTYSIEDIIDFYEE